MYTIAVSRAAVLWRRAREVYTRKSPPGCDAERWLAIFLIRHLICTGFGSVSFALTVLGHIHWAWLLIETGPIFAVMEPHSRERSAASSFAVIQVHENSHVSVVPWLAAVISFGLLMCI